MAIVHEQDIARGEIVGQAVEDDLRIAFPGIERAARPGGQFKVEAGQHRLQQRVAQAGGGAEELRRLAGDVGQRGLGGAGIRLRMRRRPKVANSAEWESPWFSMRWPRATISRQSAGYCRA